MRSLLANQNHRTGTSQCKQEVEDWDYAFTHNCQIKGFDVNPPRGVHLNNQNNIQKALCGFCNCGSIFTPATQQKKGLFSWLHELTTHSGADKHHVLQNLWLREETHTANIYKNKTNNTKKKHLKDRIFSFL